MIPRGNICPDCGGELWGENYAIVQIAPRVPGQTRIEARLLIDGLVLDQFHGQRDTQFVEWYHAKAEAYQRNLHFHWLPLPEKGRAE